MVKKGETLSHIAEQHGVAVSELKRLNDLDNPNRLQIGQKIALPAKDKPYTVQKGDALSRIAKDHGVTVQQIVIYNNMADADQLRVGQVLRIPLTSTTYVAGPVLPSSVRRDMDRIKVDTRRWKYIVIHHSASKRGTTAGMDRYHREERHMENGLAYHFVIGNGRGMIDGKIDVGTRWRRQIQGGHLASSRLNEQAIGICLVGNFDTSKPSAKQMQRLEALTEYLMKLCTIPPKNVQTHTQINTKPTRCPGKYFPTSEFKVRISS